MGWFIINFEQVYYEIIFSWVGKSKKWQFFFQCCRLADSNFNDDVLWQRSLLENFKDSNIANIVNFQKFKLWELYCYSKFFFPFRIFWYLLEVIMSCVCLNYLFSNYLPLTIFFHRDVWTLSFNVEVVLT